MCKLKSCDEDVRILTVGKLISPNILIERCTGDLNYMYMSGVKTKPLFYKRCTCWSIVYTNDHVYKMGCKVMKFEAFIWTETSKMASRRRSEDGVMWCKNGKEEFFCTYFYRADL